MAFWFWILFKDEPSLQEVKIFSWVKNVNKHKYVEASLYKFLATKKSRAFVMKTLDLESDTVVN